MDTELRILNLEDNVTDSELLQHVLRKEGFLFSFMRTETRQGFIEALESFKPDMILSDFSLPSFDGMTALTIASEMLPDVPFIFISGTLGEEKLIEILRTGATDYVLKHRLSRLAPVVRRALQEKKERAIRRQTQEALRKSEELYRQIVETAQEGIWIIDTHGNTRFVNRRTAEILGYSAEEIGTTPMADFMDEEARESVLEQLEQEGEEIEFRMRHRDGSRRWVSLSASRLVDDQGGTLGILAMINDITARKVAEEERNRLWAAVETGGDWVLITDTAGRIEYVNTAVETISGYDRSEIIGNNARMFKSEKQDEALYRQMWDALLNGVDFRSLIINRKKDGALCYLDLTITPVRDRLGTVTHFVATGKDISEKRMMEERLNYLAYNDMLTGLANRTLFFDRLQQAITIGATGKKLVVVAVVDLQRFKYINETFGAAAGDEILQEVGRRLVGCVRTGDTVSRYGGDSFGLILLDIGGMRDAILVIEKVITLLSAPYQCDQQEVINTFSIGIATCPTDSSDPEQLVKYAEAALFKAKEQRGNGYRFYTPGMNIIADNFLSMEKDLYHALDANEFALHYQPYFDIATDEMKGMEALIRWRLKNGKLIYPKEFIPILEETGQIVAVGEWVIITAARQIAEWRSRRLPLVPVSVNLSPTQFRQENLVQRITTHLKVHDVPTDLLTIEITENIFVSDVEYTRRIFGHFREVGLRLSIDDFGTGYSSLSYLARLPLNNLKIDISFIVNLATDPKARSIVKVIIDMAHELGMKTIAEGVETRDQLMILKELGCDLVQGFYYSHSLPSERMGELLMKNQRHK